MYSIIDENYKVFSVKRFGREIKFTEIDAEFRHQELENAARIRFQDNFMVVTEYREFDNTENIKYVNTKNEKEWLKLIRDSENRFAIDLPVLSGMA